MLVYQIVTLSRHTLKESIRGMVDDKDAADTFAAWLLHSCPGLFLRTRVRLADMSRQDMERVWEQWGRQDARRGVKNDEVPSIFRKAYRRGLLAG